MRDKPMNVCYLFLLLTCFLSLLQYSDTALYTQLLYYSRLFDYDYALKNSKEDLKKREFLLAFHSFSLV